MRTLAARQRFHEVPAREDSRMIVCETAGSLQNIFVCVDGAVSGDGVKERLSEYAPGNDRTLVFDYWPMLNLDRPSHIQMHLTTSR